jgi:hypothetical protein
MNSNVLISVTARLSGQLLIFTDGVTEAMSPADELYSEARLEALLTNAKDPPEALTGRIIDDVESYAAGAEQADDITILAYRAESQSDASEVETLQLSAAADLKEIERAMCRRDPSRRSASCWTNY